MIEIGNKSVLEHIVDRLIQQGIDQIIVKVHYLPEKIIKTMGDRVVYYYEPVLFNWDETLKNLKNWLQDDDFLLINGDTISEVDYREMIVKHQSGTITALMDEWRAMGTWIYPKEYFTKSNLSIHAYRPKVSWFDVGTPARLEAARKHFVDGEKQICPK